MEYQTPEDLVKDVKTLFSLPDIYFQLNQMLHDQRFSLDDIGRVIAKDPALTSRLLRVVNSALYGFQSRIDTIPRAIAVVGIDDLYNLVVATCVVDRFSGITTDLIDMVDFWTQSVHCGVLSRLLARSGAVLHAERLFLAGLLHDVGSLAMYQKMPYQSEQVLLAASNDTRLIINFEQEIIGFTHADVGRALLKMWQLPEALYEVVGCYRSPELAHTHKLDAYLVNLAVSLLESARKGIAVEEVINALPDQQLDFMRLKREQIPLLMEQSAADFFEVFEMLSPEKHSKSSSASSH